MAVKNATGQSPASASENDLVPRSALEELRAELNHTKKALRASNDRYQQIFHHDSHGIRIINKDHSINLLNQAFTDMSGITPEEAVGKKCWEVFPSPFCRTPNCRLKRILDGEALIQEEIDRIKPNKQTIRCLVSASPLRDESGRIIGVIETFADIMEKLELKKQVKETEERYRALIELGNNIGEAIVMLQDVDGIEAKHTFVSDRWTNTTGYTREELLNMSLFDLAAPSCRQDLIDRYRRRSFGEVLADLFETVIIRKDGVEIPIESASALTVYQDKTANVMYIRDVTDRKKMEAELAKHKNHLVKLVEERTSQLKLTNDKLTDEIIKRKEAEKEIEKQKVSLQHLLDAIPAGIYMLNSQARITYVNKAGVKSIDKPLEQIIGKTAFEAHPERRKSLESYQTDVRIIKTGQPDRSIFSSYDHPEELRWFQLDRYPFHDDDNKVTGVIVMEVEITDRIQIENKLKQLLEQEHVLRDALEAEIQNRIEFTRALVHELKTPLTPLLGASEALATDLTQEPYKSYATSIFHGANQLSRRIDELLDVAKGEVGLLTVNRQDLAPLPLLNEVVAYMSPEATRRSQMLSSDFPASLEHIYADEERLRQILYNLINNAFKFTPRGGHVILKAGEAADHLVIEVSDNGIGIDDEARNSLFKPYQQTDKAHLGGLGLGLFLCKMLVELHHGSISVTSEKGRGTTVGVTLPLVRPTRAHPQEGVSEK